MADEIVIWPEAVLTSPTQPVKDFGPELEALLARMYDAMAKAKGIGIAANQIGVGQRVCLIDNENTIEMVNPVILERSGKALLDEGCLSVPGERFEVARATTVRAKWQDRKGEWHEDTFTEKRAHIVQHEVDHLDGTVYVMHLSPLKRDVVKRRMLKLKR